MNAFLDESRSERLDLGLSFMRQLRVSPTIAALLAEEKPATMTWGDFALSAMVEKAVHARMLRGDVRGVIGQLVRLVGPLPDDVTGNLTAVRSPDIRQEPPPRKPLATASTSAPARQARSA